MTTFGYRLHQSICDRGPLCVGIDPHPYLLDHWELPQTPKGLAQFSQICLKAFSRIAIVKIQVAFFEAYGSAGFTVLEQLIEGFTQEKVLVLADAKRGDIGSTMQAYGQAWLGEGPLSVDALTVSAYLGFGSLQPAIDQCLLTGKGIFILAATSNPQGAQIQLAHPQDGPTTIAQMIVNQVADHNHNQNTQYGSVGVVIGATAKTIPDLRQLTGPILVPGIGAQGGRLDHLRHFSTSGQLLPSISRDILTAGPDYNALRQIAYRTRDTCSQIIPIR